MDIVFQLHAPIRKKLIDKHRKDNQATADKILQLAGHLKAVHTRLNRVGYQSAAKHAPDVSIAARHGKPADERHGNRVKVAVMAQTRFTGVEARNVHKTREGC